MTHGCLICGELNYHYLKTVPLCLCKNCGLLQRVAFPQESELKEYYHGEQYYKDHNNPIPGVMFASSYVRGNKIVKFALSPSRRGVERIIDLGCGVGGTVAQFNDMGFMASGIDLNREAIDYALSRNIDCYCADLNDKLLRADMYVLSHVVEHLPDPIGTISNIKRQYPAALLYVEVPQLTALSSKDWDIAKFYAPAHISYFTITTLVNLLYVAGYEVVATQKVSTDVCCGLFKVAGQDYTHRIKNDYRSIRTYLAMAELRKRLNIKAIGFNK